MKTVPGVVGAEPHCVKSLTFVKGFTILYDLTIILRLSLKFA